MIIFININSQHKALAFVLTYLFDCSKLPKSYLMRVRTLAIITSVRLVEIEVVSMVMPTSRVSRTEMDDRHKDAYDSDQKIQVKISAIILLIKPAEAEVASTAMPASGIGGAEAGGERGDANDSSDKILAGIWGSDKMRELR